MPMASPVGSVPQRAAVPLPKVRVPLASTTLVLRPRLLGLIGQPSDGGADRPDLTFLCAPAGSGKTTLLAEWAQRRSRRAEVAVAWVSLDSGDNDIYRLWSAILTAIDVSIRWPAGSPVESLSAPSRRFFPTFLSQFVEAVEHTPVPIHLILDDAHELFDPEGLNSLDLLLRSLPSRLQVTMSARFAPALALPRLRLEGRVREIDSQQLGFTSAEATSLLGAHDVQLSAEDLQVLLDRTEGWAAGLRLAAMPLAQAEDPSAVIANFAVNDRAVADYLVGEVLISLDEPSRQFLLDTSICEQITADLARELSGRADAGAVLDVLERSNSFIMRYGSRDGWYRYHPMLRHYLRAELARQDHDRLAYVHRTAAAWFVEHGDTLTAIEHALQAGDGDHSADLLERFGLRHVLQGEGDRLRRLLAHAGDDVARRPGVALVAAATALEAADVGEADAALARMTSGASQTASPRLLGLHEAIALHRSCSAGDPVTALTVLARPFTPTGDTDLDLLIMVVRGATGIWLGARDAAESELQRALTIARASGRDWVAQQCLAHLAVVAAARMDMGSATTRAREAISFADGHGWSGTLPAANAFLALGWAAYQRLDEATVIEAGSAIRAVVEQSNDPGAVLAVEIFDAVTAFARMENRHDLVAALRDTWQQVSLIGHAPPPLVAASALIEQRMALQVGEPGWAGDVIERTERLLGASGELQMLQAVAQIHRGRTESGMRLLVPVLTGEIDCVVPVTRVEAWIWEARLADRMGDEMRGHAAIVEALAIGATHELLRPFVAGGEQVRDLLARGAGRFGRLESVADRIRTAFPPANRENLDLLTTRELELLIELPSLRTADEIASSLFVSVNTVKTHLRGIYRKLGVNSRREAIVLARRRGLL
jgi:LuxR family maltose regulon positive regulatory protein